MRRLLLSIFCLVRLSAGDLRSIEARIAALPWPLQVVTKIDWSRKPGLAAGEVMRLREEAFDAGLAAKEQCDLLPELFGLIAEQDLGVARKLLNRVPNGEDHQRRQMIDRLVERLLDRGQVEEAERLLAALPVDGDFPMDSVYMLLHDLPDARRPVWFARAREADRRGAPHYEWVFERYQGEMPEEMRREGGLAILADMLRREKQLEAYGGARMEVEFAGGQVAMRSSDLKALEMWDALSDAIPEEAEGYLATHTELREFLREHPDGLPPTATRTRQGKGGEDSAMLQRIRKNEVLWRQAREAAKTDLTAAARFADQIDGAASRIDLLLDLWRAHPEFALTLDTEETLKVLQDSSWTMIEFAEFLQAKGRAEDRDRALRMAAAKADRQLAEESSGDKANKSWRGTWQSTQTARELGFAMGRMMTVGEVGDFLRTAMKSGELQTVALVAAMVSGSGVEELGMRMTSG